MSDVYAKPCKKCSPIEVCDECLLLKGPWGEEE